MSSYLSIYIVPKRKSPEEQKKHILLTSYSRNSDLYQYFDENINPAFVGNGKETPYTVLTEEKIRLVLDDFDKDINKAKASLTEYEKYAHDNPDYIQEIIGMKEHISELQYWRDKASFIQDMIEDIPIYDEIGEICCNID